MIGTPAPFAGAMTFTGNWLYDTFNNPLAVGGHEGNFQAYVNTMTIPPGAAEVASCTSSCSASGSPPRPPPTSG